MNYYFISSDQERFLPFQQSLATLAESYVVDELEQLHEALPVHDAAGVFFIHAIGELRRIEDFVQRIRKLSTKALVVHVLDTEGLSANVLKDGPAKADAYVKMTSAPEEIQSIIEDIGSDIPPPPVARNVDDQFSDLNSVRFMSDFYLSKEMDTIFQHLVKGKPKKKNTIQAVPTAASGAGMSDNEKNDESGLSLISDFSELSLSDGTDTPPATSEDSGMDLMLPDGDDLSLSDGSEAPDTLGLSDVDALSLDDGGDPLALPDDLSLDDASADLGADVSMDLMEEAPAEAGSLKISDNIPMGEGMDLDDSDALGLDAGSSIDFSGTSLGDDDLSEDAKEKLREIDAIMESTSSQIMVAPDLDEDDDAPVAPLESIEPSNLDEPLVSDELNLDSLDFSAEHKHVEEEKPKKKKKEEKVAKEVAPESTPVQSRNVGAELKEISGAYTVEMERAQATIANLRADREELLNRIQVLEDERISHGRQGLTLRAELDEKKIELSIIRKKLNEEISDLKDRLKLHDERRLILEEKNRILSQELEKANQKNKIDLRKVQMRERELEQKLELLKSDAETQIRNRDLKILELKRKIDSMEFDMESISTQEKKSVESRFELEDKLDKAIKTLRNAITVLEEDADRESAVQTLKKNIDV